jgi:hypothetical protein
LRPEPLYPDNAIEELYYLEMNYVASSVNYQHKNNPDTMVKQYFVRVLKPLKKLNRNLLNLTSWAKYYEFENLDTLRKKIIEELIFTTKTLEEIKRTLI